MRLEIFQLFIDAVYLAVLLPYDVLVLRNQARRLLTQRKLVDRFVSVGEVRDDLH